MAAASVTYTFTEPGGNADPAQVNQNFADLVAFVNTNVVHKDGTNSMTGSLTLSADPISTLHAATKQYVDGLFTFSPTSWTPSCSQGGNPISATVNYAHYIQYKKTVFAWFFVTFTAAAPGTDVVSFSLPIDNQVGNELFGPTIGAYKFIGATSHQGTCTVNTQGFNIGQQAVRCTILNSSTDNRPAIAIGNTLSASVVYESI